jgi:membrane associated rhomboid family serine protease
VKNFLARQLYRSFFYPLCFVIVLWLVFLVQNMLPVNFVRYGILPRTVAGLPGIITSVFIHADLQHIASNTFPLLVLGAMLFYFYRKIAMQAGLWIWLIRGIWLWVGGRDGGQIAMYHIGASTLIYGLASFLFFSGIIRRHKQLMVVSMLVVFMYGSITWGIFPFKSDMSWEGHLFGALAGVLVALNYRGEGPQRRVYEWEDEPDEEEQVDAAADQAGPERSEGPEIRYHYRRSDEEHR